VNALCFLMSCALLAGCASTMQARSDYDRLDIQAYPVAYRGYWHWGHSYFGDAVDVDTYREGTLAIDVFDGKARQPVWHGWATKRITEADIRAAAEEIPLAVTAILEAFPPR
jgi:hypothetical protein